MLNALIRVVMSIVPSRSTKTKKSQPTADVGEMLDSIEEEESDNGPNVNVKEKKISLDKGGEEKND